VRVNCGLGLRHRLINADSSEIHHFLKVNRIYVLPNDNDPNYCKRITSCGTRYRHFEAVFLSAHIGFLYDYTGTRGSIVG
jgi:hypothetical protein